jgi:hypothetical protein
MKTEIGFVHLGAAILAAGLIDTPASTSRYERDQRRVIDLLDAWHSAEELSTVARRTVDRLIAEELSRWWRDSWYNLQVDVVRREIIETCKGELALLGINIISTRGDSFVTDPLSEKKFKSIQSAIDAKYPGLIYYYEKYE